MAFYTNANLAWVGYKAEIGFQIFSNIILNVNLSKQSTLKKLAIMQMIGISYMTIL
jgi:hypothetical protein